MGFSLNSIKHQKVSRGQWLALGTEHADGAIPIFKLAYNDSLAKCILQSGSEGRAFCFQQLAEGEARAKLAIYPAVAKEDPLTPETFRLLADPSAKVRRRVLFELISYFEKVEKNE